MMKINRFRGFTLIELLVVIAIIGILSAVVLASLNTARSKGQDAAIQSNLQTVQVQAEIYYGGTGTTGGDNSYGGTGSGSTAAECIADANSMWLEDSTISRAIVAAEAVNTDALATVICGSNSTNYAISARMPSTITGTASYYCVDSGGFAGPRTTSLVAGTTVCPAI